MEERGVVKGGEEAPRAPRESQAQASGKSKWID